MTAPTVTYSSLQASKALLSHGGPKVNYSYDGHEWHDYRGSGNCQSNSSPTVETRKDDEFASQGDSVRPRTRCQKSIAQAQRDLTGEIQK